MFLAACQSNPHKVSNYFNASERDTLLTNIVTYVYQKAPYASNETKFQPQFRQFYVKNLPLFSIENLYQAPDSTNYFFVVRPVGNNAKYRRGVLGKFRLKKGSLMPTDFEEIINTPHLEEATVKERGNFLFKELVKNGNLDKYLSMKHYIEWPDSTLVYDKKNNGWVSTHKL
jgi:hypothetical protein